MRGQSNPECNKIFNLVFILKIDKKLYKMSYFNVFTEKVSLPVSKAGFGKCLLRMAPK